MTLQETAERQDSKKLERERWLSLFKAGRWQTRSREFDLSIKTDGVSLCLVYVKLKQVCPSSYASFLVENLDLSNDLECLFLVVHESIVVYRYSSAFTPNNLLAFLNSTYVS